MSIDAIGASLGTPTASATSPISNTTLNQSDLIKLFLTELQYQDPMDPVNNEQFLAQLAQFATLQTSEDTDTNMQNLVFMNSASQSLSLLSKDVEMVDAQGNTVDGTITAIQFSTSGPLLTVTASDGSVQTDVQLAQINLVRP